MQRVSGRKERSNDFLALQMKKGQGGTKVVNLNRRRGQIKSKTSELVCVLKDNKAREALMSEQFMLA